MKNTNKTFRQKMLHIFLLLLGAAACLMGLVTLFFPTAGNTGSEIPKIGRMRRTRGILRLQKT